MCWCSDPSTGSHSRGRAFFPGPSVLALPCLAVPSGPRAGPHWEQDRERLPGAQGADGRSPAAAVASGWPCHTLHRSHWVVCAQLLAAAPARACVPSSRSLQACRAWSCRCPWGTCSHTLTPPHTHTLCGQGTGPSLEQGCLPSLLGLPAGQALGVCTYPSSSLRVSLQQVSRRPAEEAHVTARCPRPDTGSAAQGVSSLGRAESLPPPPDLTEICASL